MPCGGIYPIKGSWVVDLASFGTCYHCGLDTNGNDLWVEEWDAPIHSKCVDDFLKTKEGQIVLKHGHEVIRE
jgi:hypothetical protein